MAGMTDAPPDCYIRTPMNHTPIVSARGLSRHYPLGKETVPALSQADLDVMPADFLVLQGPSGSGKTTLINLLGLLDSPDAGSILLDGVNAASLSDNARADARRDRFGFIFQNFNLIPVLTAAENIAYPMVLKHTAADTTHKRARELLAAVGLTDKAEVRPDLLSGGQRQRVAIARALANAPNVIFADEPTANLDTHTADTILDLMQVLNREQGVAFVIATHDPRVVARAGRVVTLRDGRIMAAST
jgi:putative ABC transport system ATP-binding protein